MYKKVFTKEKWQRANKLNKELLEDYLIELKSKRRRPSTLQQYESDGKMILCFIQEHMDNRCVLDFNKKDFRRISLWLTEERKVSNARFNRVFALIRGMMEYAEDEDDYDYEKNLARKIKGLPKEPVREIYFLTDEQIHKIRTYLLEHEMYRECAYLDISYDSAARIGEVLQIKKDGLLERRYTNIVVGKRGKKFRLLYHYNSLESLKLYLNSREDNIESLWIDQDHNHAVTDNTLYDWCIKMRSILNLLEDKYIPFTPHSFRHSALENYKNGTHYMCERMNRPDGFSIEEIQILAHHDNIDTTKGYLKPNDNNILEGMFGVKLE